jgi:hypothetical protein
MAAKEAKVKCPFKDGRGYCCHREMVILKTSPKVLCPFNNVEKCKLYQRSIRRFSTYNKSEPNREDLLGPNGESYKFNQKALQRPWNLLFEGYKR